jgi:outer membrane protein OmpA-like peptidoglycan-associated protein
MKKLLFICSGMLLAGFSFAQDAENLVENGSFETIKGKLRKPGQIEVAPGWTASTGMKVDLFSNETKEPKIMVPKNYMGKEHPKEGSSYAGFVAYSHNNKLPRSYPATKIKSKMKKGLKYCVKFYVNLSERSKYSSNNIAANFSKKGLVTEGKVSITADSDIIKFDNKSLTGMYGWDEICGIYTAKGGEQYMTIGNFMSNGDTESEKMKMPKDMRGAQIVSAFYYLDDITVKLITEEAECNCGQDAEELYSKMIYSKKVYIKESMTDQEKVKASIVYFGFGSDNVEDVFNDDLKRVLDILKANTSVKIKIAGHSDKLEVEKGENNDKLYDMSKKRIQSVKAFLKKNGIGEGRIMESNRNDLEPIDDSGSEEGQAKNRRVTFQLM